MKGHGGGPGTARNIGLEEIQGEYLICLDGDDIFELSMLEEMYRVALQDNSDIVVCMVIEQDETGRQELMRDSINLDMIPNTSVFNCMDCPNTFFRSFIGWAWDKLIKTSLYRENHLQFGNYFVAEDAAFVIAAMARAERITVLRKALVYHRKNTASLEATPANFKNHWRDSFSSFTYIKSKLEEWGMYDVLRIGYLNWVVHYSLWLLDRVPDDAHNEMRLLLETKIWPDLAINQLYKEDFLYQSELAAYERICGSLPSKYQQQSQNDQTGDCVMAAYRKLVGDYNAMRSSWSFKIGRMITWLPRKVRGGIRCLQENGFRYTLKRCGEKLMGQ